MWRFGLSVFFSLCNIYTDWTRRKIYNRLVVPFFAMGILLNAAADGWSGALFSMKGSASALALLPLFALRMIGAGDVKALIAIGAMIGFPSALYVLLYSFVGAGLMAVLTLLARRNGCRRFYALWIYLKGCVLARKALPYPKDSGTDGGGNFPFSVGIMAGLLLRILENAFG